MNLENMDLRGLFQYSDRFDKYLNQQEIVERDAKLAATCQAVTATAQEQGLID